MTHIRTAIGALLLLLLAAPPAFAQQTWKGMSEITTFALVSTTFGEGSAASQSALFFTYGKYLTDRDLVAGGPIIFITRVAGDTQGTLGMTSSYRRLLNPRGGGEIIPYVGGELFVLDVSPPEGTSLGDSMFINGIAGIKYLFTDELALDTKGSFGFSPGGGGQALQLTVGLSYRF